MGFKRIIVSLMAAAILAVVFPWFLPSVFGQGCATRGDWKDINILPTNGSPDSNIKISLTVDKTVAVPGDEIVLTIVADRDCYVTIMNLGTSGRIVRLWPNAYSGNDNFVSAGVPRRFPDVNDGFRYKVAGPVGVERIIGYASMEKGKILDENEFQGLQGTGFKQFVGGAKDLAKSFHKNTTALGTGTPWGTGQVNVCIGTGATERPAETGQVYVLSIGAATGELKYCSRDAQRFSDAVISKMGVKESNVRLILGAEATHDGFSKGLEWLASTTQPEDTVVIFFSGHGTSIPDQAPSDEEDGKDECFVLYHTKPPQDYVTALRERVLMVDDEFNRILKTVQARKKLILVDSCHSGTISKEIGARTKNYVSKYLPLKDPRTGEKMWNLRSKSEPPNYGNDNEALMSACMDDQVSYEDQSKQAGLFTHHLLEAINSGASDLEKAFETAKQSVERETSEFARQSSGSAAVQTPSLTDPHGLAKLYRFGR